MASKRLKLRLIFILLSALSMTFCTPKEKGIAEPEYKKSTTVEKPLIRFAVHPLHNPELLNDVFGPLINYLNEHITEVHFQLEASVNYPAFEEKLKKREVQFALPNPYQTIMSLSHGYKVFGKMADDYNFRGIILIRKDSNIKSFEDLKGKTISYPAATALAATMLPQYLLYTHGLKINDTKNIYVGSQESSIMNVYLKTSQAGATWPPPWNAFVAKNPEIAKELKVQWQTETLANNGLVVRDDVSPAIIDKVKKVIFKMHQDPEGQKILQGIGLSKFEAADENTYKSVKKFLEIFSRKVRPPDKEL
ncbi:MAG: phosphate/phosphite/phosphonate ABC transporter substrate-binding protein [Bdellovibrio sp.]